MNPLEKEIAALKNRLDTMELAIWSLETSEERHWKLICELDDKLNLKLDLPGTGRVMERVKKRSDTETVNISASPVVDRSPLEQIERVGMNAYKDAVSIIKASTGQGVDDFIAELKVRWPTMGALIESTLAFLYNPDRSRIPDHSDRMVRENITDIDIVNSRDDFFANEEVNFDDYMKQAIGEAQDGIVDAWKTLIIIARVAVMNDVTNNKLVTILAEDLDTANKMSVKVLKDIQEAIGIGWHRADLERLRKECIDLFFTSRDVMQERAYERAVINR